METHSINSVHDTLPIGRWSTPFFLFVAGLFMLALTLSTNPTCSIRHPAQSRCQTWEWGNWLGGTFSQPALPHLPVESSHLRSKISRNGEEPSPCAVSEFLIRRIHELKEMATTLCHCVGLVYYWEIDNCTEKEMGSSNTPGENWCNKAEELLRGW